MSSHPHLFFDPGHVDAMAAARALAEVLDMTAHLAPFADIPVVFTMRLSDEVPVQFGGPVEPNIYGDGDPDDPEDVAV